MARNINTNHNTNEGLDTRFNIRNAKWIKDNTVCLFSIDLPDLCMTLKGMSLRYVQKDGKELAILNPPSYKGSDGNWYGHFWVRFSDSMQAEIVNQLESL